MHVQPRSRMHVRAPASERSGSAVRRNANARIIYAKFVGGARVAKRKMQNTKCKTARETSARADTGHRREKGRPGKAERDCGMRPAVRVQPIGNQHTALCNLSNCSLCYFLLSFHGPRDALPARPRYFPPRFLAQLSTALACTWLCEACAARCFSAWVEKWQEKGRWERKRENSIVCA